MKIRSKYMSGWVEAMPTIEAAIKGGYGVQIIINGEVYEVKP
jgi:hypothetical protein